MNHFCVLFWVSVANVVHACLALVAVRSAIPTVEGRVAKTQTPSCIDPALLQKLNYLRLRPRFDGEKVFNTVFNVPIGDWRFVFFICPLPTNDASESVVLNGHSRRNPDVFLAAVNVVA